MSSVTQLGLTNLNNIDKVSESTYWVNKNFYLDIRENQDEFKKTSESVGIWSLFTLTYIFILPWISLILEMKENLELNISSFVLFYIMISCKSFTSNNSTKYIDT